MRGPPTSFTPEIGKRILAAFGSGCFASTAAQSCGVVPKTLLHWVTRGQSQTASVELQEFSNAFLVIDAQREVQVIKRIRAATDPQEITVQRTETNEQGEQKTVAEVRTTPGDWRASAWFAERRWRKHWSAPKDGQQENAEELQASRLIEEAHGREPDLDEVIAEMPPELEAALLRNADRVRALLDKGR